jgi:hypothetical protein
MYLTMLTGPTSSIGLEGTFLRPFAVDVSPKSKLLNSRDEWKRAPLSSRDLEVFRGVENPFTLSKALFALKSMVEMLPR